MRALFGILLVLRRMLAVLFVPVLVVAFALSLVTGRLNDTLLDAGFIKEQLRELDFYDRFHDDGIPALVETFAEQQEEDLPENLRGIDLPTDQESLDKIIVLLQTLLPRDYLQQEVEQTIDAIIPWVAAKEEDFELTVSMHDNVLAVFAHPSPGEPSLFEQTWRDINFGERVLTSLVASVDEMRAAEAGGNASTDGGGGENGGPSPIDLLRADTPGAVAWLEGNLFGAIDSVLPYILGDREHFSFLITFDDFPYLAEGFASVLNEDPVTLRNDGWGFSDTELREALDQSEQEFVSNADGVFAFVRPHGLTITSDDLIQKIEEQQERSRLEHEQDLAARGVSADEEPFDEGLDPREVRDVMKAGRLLLVWGPVVLGGLLVVAIGFLGGRRWWSRLLWASTALLIASGVAFLASGFVYGRSMGDAIDDYVAERKAEPESRISVELRDALLDQLEATSEGVVRHMSATSRNWFVLSLLGVAGAITLAVVGGRPEDREWAGAATAPLEPPPSEDGTPPT